MDNEKLLTAVSDTVAKTTLDAIEKAFPTLEEASKKTARQVVETMMAERAVKGTDITGLTGEQKKDFAAQVIATFSGQRGKALRILETKTGGTIDGVMTKANEALIEEQDNRGGYLVQPEVAAAILRIAASVGTIMKQAQKWPMKTDELGIPNYTGAFLTGQYVGVDIPSTVQGLTFGQAVLIARKWQLPFVVGNDLLADASVQLGEWLLAMAGEALANMIDQQGFVGGATINGSTSGTSTTYTGPFQGILGLPNGSPNTYTLASGGTTYAKFNPVTDAANVVATVEESVLDGCAWYMHRTVWASIASQLASTSGLPFLFFGAFAANQSGLEKDPLGGPIRPAGHMMGFPVLTNRWLPATTIATQANTPFMIFGNLKAMAFGDKGDIRVGDFQSGVWAGKELGLSDQTGIVYKHRHALVVVLPKAFTVVYTSAS
jgi:HK97 family phage major capsid protein